MFERLACAVEDLEVPVDGDAIAQLVRVMDRLAAKVSAALGEYDAAGGWEHAGATSATAWLRYRAGMTSSAAGVMVRTARRLRELPATRAAWLEGTLSGGQVQAVVANVDDRTAPLFADQEHALLPTLVPLPVHHVATVMQSWRARAEALLEDGAQGTMPVRRVHLSRTLGGRFVLDGELDVEGGEIVATALRLAMTGDVGGEPGRTPAERRADATVDIFRFFLDHQQQCRGGRHRPHLNVVVSLESLMAGGPGQVVGGGYVDGATVQRLLCDAAVHRVVTDGRSTILDYGTATRTVPANLWSALVLRDGHCRHDGCDRPPDWCEAHHVVPVAKGGPTSLDNLVLKCTRHHHLGHQPGWEEELHANGTLVVTDPQGRTQVTHPRGPAVLRLPVPPPSARPEGGGFRPAGPRRGRRRDRRGTAPPAHRSVRALGAVP